MPELVYRSVGVCHVGIKIHNAVFRYKAQHLAFGCGHKADRLPQMFFEVFTHLLPVNNHIFCQLYFFKPPGPVVKLFWSKRAKFLFRCAFLKFCTRQFGILEILYYLCGVSEQFSNVSGIVPLFGKPFGHSLFVRIFQQVFANPVSNMSI
ncbi:MAG: hypothetical protein LBH61_06355 [Dysgonamonadaceae bacterium]|nr:hypothetical protein [Dysgonamonadaceae bacterium]